jgi:hypothetical protein
MRIELLGIYAVEASEPCHLLELMVSEHVGKVDIGAFTQEQAGQPRPNWQVPWHERVLNAEGTMDVLGRFSRKVVADGNPLRLVFYFHYLDLDKPLITPAGEIALQRPQERPPRLAFLKYDPPD